MFPYNTHTTLLSFTSGPITNTSTCPFTDDGELPLPREAQPLSPKRAAHVGLAAPAGGNVDVSNTTVPGAGHE